MKVKKLIVIEVYYSTSPEGENIFHLQYNDKSGEVVIYENESFQTVVLMFALIVKKLTSDKSTTIGIDFDPVQDIVFPNDLGSPFICKTLPTEQQEDFLKYHSRLQKDQTT